MGTHEDFALENIASIPPAITVIRRRRENVGNCTSITKIAAAPKPTSDATNAQSSGVRLCAIFRRTVFRMLAIAVTKVHAHLLVELPGRWMK